MPENTLDSAARPSERSGEEIAGGDSWRMAQGPLLLALTFALLAMMAMWETWRQRPPAESALARLTVLGKSWYRPDYDMPVYVGGVVAAIVLAVVAEGVWRRRLRRAVDTQQRERLRRLLGWHVPVAGGLALLPLLRPGCAGIAWLGAGLAAGAWGLLWVAGRAGARPALRWPAAPRAVLVAAHGLMAAAAIVLLVDIPDTTPITSQMYRTEKFHHWDFFAMAPALAYRHGAALGTEAYAQYGMGWPVLLAWSSRFTPLSYGTAVRLAVAVGCAYYFGLFLFLRNFLRSSAWAFTGLFLTLGFALFSGIDKIPKWAYPSSTPLRCILDVALYATGLQFARTGRWGWGFLAGALIGLAIVWNTETGLYLGIALSLFTLASARRPAAAAARQAWAFAGAGLVGGLATLLPALALASRGTLLQPAFWHGWFEALGMYGGGIGHLPIGDNVQAWSSYVTLFAGLLVYLFFMVRWACRVLYRCCDADTLVAGMIAVTGLGELLNYVGRSHAFNLHHASIPCVLLTTCVLARAVQSALGQPKAAPRRADAARPGSPAVGVAWLCALLALVTVCANEHLATYPNWLQRLLGEGPPRPANALFASRGDVWLPDDCRPAIQRFAAISAAIKELSRGGRAVAVIDTAETHYLLEADVRPFFRYTPVLANLLYREQTARVKQQLAEHPPDHILMPTEVALRNNKAVAADTYGELRALVGKRYRLVNTVEDMEIFERMPESEPRRPEREGGG